MVEEFRAVIGMQVADREREPVEHPLKTRFHRRLPPPEDRRPLAPPRRHIHELQGVDVLTRRAFSAVMD